jgi:hypothetical protein
MTLLLGIAIGAVVTGALAWRVVAGSADEVAAAWKAQVEALRALDVMEHGLAKVRDESVAQRNRAEGLQLALTASQDAARYHLTRADRLEFLLSNPHPWASDN